MLDLLIFFNENVCELASLSLVRMNLNQDHLILLAELIQYAARLTELDLSWND